MKNRLPLAPASWMGRSGLQRRLEAMFPDPKDQKYWDVLLLLKECMEGYSQHCAKYPVPDSNPKS